MDGWIWVDGWIDGWMDICAPVYVYTNIYNHICTCKLTEKDNIFTYRRNWLKLNLEFESIIKIVILSNPNQFIDMMLVAFFT